MEFVGRKPSSAMQPRACMCNTDARFLTGKSSSDTCANCGCICGIILSNGNLTTARHTDRTS